MTFLHVCGRLKVKLCSDTLPKVQYLSGQHMKVFTRSNTKDVSYL